MNEKLAERQLSPSSPPPKPSTRPNHNRDTSLQDILRQFDPLSPERKSIDKPPTPPPKDDPRYSPTSQSSRSVPSEKNVGDTKAGAPLRRRASILSIDKPPPAEPDQPFEFHRFLDQMRHKSADGVARYMKRYTYEKAQLTKKAF